jgi:phage terminase large subunit GpA-like protein
MGLTTAALISSAFAAGLRPEPDLTVSEWADTYRMVGKPSPEPGPWMTSRVPYTREIMDRLSPSDPCEIVVLEKAAQGAGTEIGLNFIGCCMHRYPDSSMIVQPTVDIAKKFSRTRFDRLVEATPVLRGLVAAPRSRTAANSWQLKEFGPGRDSLVFAGANSGSALRSYPSRFGLADEIDGYPLDLDGEGNPVDLFIQRTAAYSNRKIFLLSTPTLEEISAIHKWFLAGDQNHFYVPCPLCGHEQVLIWGADRAKDKMPGGIRWERGNPRTAKYQCEKCGDQFEEWRKAEILPKGFWQPGAKGNGDGKIRSYHVGSLIYPYGWPGNAWTNLAAEWERVHRDPVRLKTFVNLKLGQPWKDPSEAKADAATLLQRCESYGPELPAGVAVLTAGVDVQGNRIEAELVGWGRDEESWSIEYRVFVGDTSQQTVWGELDNWLKGEWLSELDVSLAIRGTCIDSGYNHEIVRKFCTERRGRHIWPTKGANGRDRPVWPTKLGKQRGPYMPPVIIGVDYGKEIIYSRLKLPAPGPGFCHFPRALGYDLNYFEMLTAEIRIPNYTGPAPKFVWQKKQAGARNESLDARNNAYAALQGLGITTALRLNREVDQLLKLAEARTAPPPTAPAAGTKSSWLGNRGGGGWFNR